MGTAPFAPVTAVDAATSIGAVDALVLHLDHRYPDYDYQAAYAGTLVSSGSADKVRIQVSPDAPENSSLGEGVWVDYAVHTCATFQGAIPGPWKALRVLKPGDQTAKVVFMTNGRNRKNQQQ